VYPIIPEKNYVSSNNQTCQKRQQLSFPTPHKILTAMDFLAKQTKAIVKGRAFIGLYVLQTADRLWN